MVLSFYCIILALICQPLVNVAAITEEQSTAVSTHCTTIKDSLKNVQKNDSRARFYLGSYYEKILSKFMIPLNVRLVENNLSMVELIKNQNDLADSKATFVNDFIDYQRELETLVAMDCTAQPEEFYEQLVVVRGKRQTVAEDVQELRGLVTDHMAFIVQLKEKMT